jgi:hypothetical protein
VYLNESVIPKRVMGESVAWKFWGIVCSATELITVIR